jgi:hypothetical protein
MYQDTTQERKNITNGKEAGGRFNLKDTICDQICNDLADYTSERWIRKCLPDEYKQHKRKKSIEESTGQLPDKSGK